MSGSLTGRVHCLAPEYLEMRIQGIMKLIMQQQISLRCTSEQLSKKPQTLHRVYSITTHDIKRHFHE